MVLGNLHMIRVHDEFALLVTARMQAFLHAFAKRDILGRKNA